MPFPFGAAKASRPRVFAFPPNPAFETFPTRSDS